VDWLTLVYTPRISQVVRDTLLFIIPSELILTDSKRQLDPLNRSKRIFTQNDQMKEEEVDWACRTHDRDEKCIDNFSCKT